MTYLNWKDIDTYFKFEFEWKQWYVSNAIYNKEAGLVQPDGVKECACCHKQKYAVEYIDLFGGLQDDFTLSYKQDAVLGDPENDYFYDRLLPVCNECVRMRVAKPDGKYKKSPTGGLIGRDILALCADLTVECDRCGQDYTLDGLMMMTSKNQVGKRCQGCAQKQIKGQFGQ